MPLDIWLIAEYAVGVRFIVLEGLTRSGKSTLTKQPFVLASRPSADIELDQFLRRPVDPDIEYMTAIDIEAAIRAVAEAYRTAPLVIIEGPIVSPVIEPVLLSIPSR